MEELLKAVRAERYQIEDHIEHGDLEQYIRDNHEDLSSVLKRTEKLLTFLLERSGSNAA